MHPLWFYKHQHENRVHSKLFVACQWWWFQWWFWFVHSVPGYLREKEEHKPDPWHNPIERNHMGLHVENETARQVASDHHRSHAWSIAAVNAGLKILWCVSGNGAGSALCSSSSRKYPGTEGTNQTRHWHYHHWHATVWNELDFRVDVCRITKSAHIEHL